MFQISSWEIASSNTARTTGIAGNSTLFGKILVAGREHLQLRSVELYCEPIFWNLQYGGSGLKESLHAIFVQRRENSSFKSFRYLISWRVYMLLGVSESRDNKTANYQHKSCKINKTSSEKFCRSRYRFLTYSFSGNYCYRGPNSYKYIQENSMNLRKHEMSFFAELIPLSNNALSENLGPQG